MTGVGAASSSSSSDLGGKESTDVPAEKTSRLTVSQMPGFTATSAQDADELLTNYLSQNSNLLTDGRSGNMQALDALLDLIDQIEPATAFSIFCSQMLNVDRLAIGTDQDPTENMLRTAVERAPSSFWAGASTEENKESLENLTRRCRNWMAVIIRGNSYVKLLPALRLLIKLPLTDTLIRKVGLPTTVRHLETLSPPLDNILGAAREFEAKHSAAFSSETGAQHQTSSNSKLFGDGGALRLRTHKRVRESSDHRKESPVPQDNASEQEEALENDRRKRAKHSKRVHWKPASELVQVRFFEMDGIAKFKSAKNARLQEHDEGSAMHPHLEWVRPKLIEFRGVFGNEQLRVLMSTRRGGLKEPESAEAETQRTRQAKGPPYVKAAADDLQSPTEPPPEESAPDLSWTPREGGKFTPVAAPQEWLQKQSVGMSGGIIPGMNPMVPPMMPQMMPSFPWGMNYPMNMGMTPAQMNEFMRLSNGMFGRSTQQ